MPLCVILAEPPAWRGHWSCTAGAASQALRTTVNLQTIYPNKGQCVERKIHGKQMNKQHQLWGGWPFCPTPWHRFHTKSQQIEVDMPGVKTLVLTMLQLYVHRAVVRRGGRKWREGEGCVNEKSHIMGLGLFYREQNGSIWALRLSKLASVRYERFIQGDTWIRCLQC